MKILSLHSDYIKFKATKKALKKMEDLPEDSLRLQEVKDALVILVAVEKGDEIKSSSKELVKNIKDIVKQIGLESKTVVLYPYAHLSPNLGSPEVAVGVLDSAEKVLVKDGFYVARAPFGYYKEFEMKVKGHPLAELSRSIGSEQSVGRGLHPTHDPARSPKSKIDSQSRSPTQSEVGDEKINPKQLLREIGKSILDRSKLKENDHRIIGQEMDLFSFSEVAPGSAFWHSNGMVIYNSLVGLMREILVSNEYQEISTPQVLDNRLWKISGHWGHYKDNMFLTEYESRDAGVKPMNCPGAMMLFRGTSRSYKELPLRFAEFGVVHRKELSGVLAGLFRVVKFTQDDAHIFLSQAQLGKEIEDLFKIVKTIYKDTFGFDYTLELSTRPEKFMGEKKDWDASEKALEDALKKSKLKYKINKGDGSFYGPKIDIHIKDSLKRSWQMGTIQLDMQMPQRFELKYTDKDNKEKTPLVLHRAIFGSVERFIGILLEHTRGRLPTWLAPVQIRVLNFTDRNTKASEKILSELKKEIPGLRVDSDFRQTTLQSKVKDAEILRVPYIVVIGDKEEKAGTLAVREKGSPKIKEYKFSEFVKKLRDEIEGRK